MKITIVAGARPNFIKIAPLIREIKRRPDAKIEYRLVHTGQHYDAGLSDIFFKELEIPPPDVNFAVGSGSQAEQTAKIMVEFEKDLAMHPCDIVVVVGDVNSTMACSIVTKKLQIRLAHVEAGIRSHDFTMPEEINRIVTDALSDYFFTTSIYANENLVKSGVDSTKIFFVGNIMIDTLLWAKNKFRKPDLYDKYGLVKGGYFVITLHRPSNVDDAMRLRQIMASIEKGIGNTKAVFPVHPRTAKILKASHFASEKIIMLDPMSYLEFMYLVDNALGVITDSGGIQEETTVLGIPCLTLRNNTERPETVSDGTNQLMGDNMGLLVSSLDKIKSGVLKDKRTPDLWDGKTAERIVKILSVL